MLTALVFLLLTAAGPIDHPPSDLRALGLPDRRTVSRGGSFSAQDTPLDMMTYQVVLLRRASGHTAPGETAEAQKRQQGHLAHLAKLNRDRVNVLYGPFLDEGDPVGIAVLDVKDADAARKAFAEDPYVKAGEMLVEVKPWMAPKGWFHPPLDSNPANPDAREPLIFGVLVRGPNPPLPPAEAEQIQKGHLAYMGSLVNQGKLVAAGPFLDDSSWRGIVIYRVPTVEDAKQLAAGDPAVKSGRLVLEARPWMTLKGILK